MLDHARAARTARETRKPAEKRGFDNSALANVELMIGTCREYRRTGEEHDRERVGDAANGVILTVQ